MKSQAHFDQAVATFHETGKIPDAETLFKIGISLVDFVKFIIDSLKGRKVKVLTDIVTHLATENAEMRKDIEVIKIALDRANLLS